MKQLTNDIFKILIELFVFDRTKRSKIKARWAKKHLAEYLEVPPAVPVEENKEQVKEILHSIQNDIIWGYWHQGKENAPELIQKCFESVQNFEGDKNIVVLSFDTVKDYVDIPQKYYDMVNSKKIPIAIFSDIVRLYLLEKYGGMWIDSTILLTDKIPQEVWDSSFCVFQKDPKTDMQENRMSCYFIRAKKGSPNLRAIKKSIENYWAKNDFLINYFMFEHISTMLSEKPELKSEWEKMPYLDAKKAGLAQRYGMNEETLKEYFAHKLTYKKQASKKF